MQTITLEQAVQAFLAHRKRANCAMGTVQLYARHLTAWGDWLRAQGRAPIVADLGIDDLRGFADHLRESRDKPLSENTHASYHRTLRAFWTFLGIEELITPEQQRFFTRIPAPSVPEDPRPVTDYGTVRRLVAACGDGSSEESARNRAIVLFLFETGMRISELCNLTDEVCSIPKRRARVLRAKGGKHRMVFWQPSGGAALARYLLMRRGKHGGPLFRGTSIRNSGGQLTPDLVRKALQRIADGAGITLPKGAPLHSLRHGFAHAALERGAQLTDLADLLGHADLETTRIYVRNDDTRLEAAYNRIFSRGSASDRVRGDAESHG